MEALRHQATVPSHVLRVSDELQSMQDRLLEIRRLLRAMGYRKATSAPDEETTINKAIRPRVPFAMDRGTG
jgi:hypothetical protein